MSRITTPRCRGSTEAAHPIQTMVDDARDALRQRKIKTVSEITKGLHVKMESLRETCEALSRHMVLFVELWTIASALQTVSLLAPVDVFTKAGALASLACFIEKVDRELAKS